MARLRRAGLDRTSGRGVRVVRVEPGLVVRELDSATQKAGLAMVLGGCGSVGIGGFTLGGGEGALCGKYGLSCDNLLSAEAVLADGAGSPRRQMTTQTCSGHYAVVAATSASSPLFGCARIR